MPETQSHSHFILPSIYFILRFVLRRDTEKEKNRKFPFHKEGKETVLAFRPRRPRQKRVLAQCRRGSLPANTTSPGHIPGYHRTKLRTFLRSLWKERRLKNEEERFGNFCLYNNRIPSPSLPQMKRDSRFLWSRLIISWSFRVSRKNELCLPDYVLIAFLFSFVCSKSS